MKRIGVIIAILLFACLSANAQFGIRASYNVNNAPEWDRFFSTVLGADRQAFSSSTSFTLDYWTRLPEKRIEFYPNISYHIANSDLLSTSGDRLSLDLRQIGLGIITHFYILDLVGDCDCPTFSKQGGLVKKGFFLMAGVGADFSQKKFLNYNYRDGNIDFKASVGFGLDIGLIDLITITPFAQLQYFPAISWHEIGPSLGIPDVSNLESSFTQIQLGIRAGFRPDYK